MVSPSGEIRATWSFSVLGDYCAKKAHLVGGINPAGKDISAFQNYSNYLTSAVQASNPESFGNTTFTLQASDLSSPINYFNSQQFTVFMPWIVHFKGLVRTPDLTTGIDGVTLTVTQESVTTIAVTDNTGAFSILLSSYEPTMEYARSVTILPSKTTGNITHEFTCQFGNDPVITNCHEIGITFTAAEYLRRYEDIKIRDISSSVLTGRVIMKNAGADCGVQGVTVSIAYTGSSIGLINPNPVQTNSNGFYSIAVLLQTSGRYMDMNCIITYTCARISVSYAPDNYVHTFEPASLGFLGVDVGINGGFDFVDNTTATLDFDLSATLCKFSLGQATYRLQASCGLYDNVILSS